jgi:hypothetical protein
LLRASRRYPFDSIVEALDVFEATARINPRAVGVRVDGSVDWWVYRARIQRLLPIVVRYVIDDEAGRVILCSIGILPRGGPPGR